MVVVVAVYSAVFTPFPAASSPVGLGPRVAELEKAEPGTAVEVRAGEILPPVPATTLGSISSGLSQYISVS